MKRIGLKTGALLLAGVFGCSAAPPPPGNPPVPTATAKPPDALLIGVQWARAKFSPRESLVHGFVMPLPDVDTWAISDPENGWFVAKHAASNTTIAARMLATDGLANRARCEKRARDLLPLPEREGATMVDRQRVDLPSGFDTVLEVGLAPTNPGQPIEGFLLAIGGWAKRCFVYTLTTRAAGPGAEQAVGDRLALFVEKSFLDLRFTTDLVPTVPREKLPGQ